MPTTPPKQSRPTQEAKEPEPTFPASHEFYRQVLQRCEGDARKGGEEIVSILSALGTNENRLHALARATTKQALADLAIYANASEVLDTASEFGGRIVETYLTKDGKVPSGLLLAVVAGLLSAGLPLTLNAQPEEDRIERSEMVPEALLKKLFGE